MNGGSFFRPGTPRFSTKTAPIIATPASASADTASFQRIGRRSSLASAAEACVGMMDVELVVSPRRAIGLGRAGSEFFHLIVERRPESLGFDRGQRLRARSSGLGGAPRRRRLAVRDPHMREFDQTRQFRERIFGARLLCARGAQSPLEFVEVDLVRRT